MDLLLRFDPYLLAGLGMGLTLAVCVAILFAIRDRERAPARHVSRALWCATRGQRATVDFVERVETGVVFRSVQACSLRAAGGQCDELCAAMPAAEMRPVRERKASWHPEFT